MFKQFIDDFVMKKTLKYHLMNYVSDEQRKRDDDDEKEI